MVGFANRCAIRLSEAPSSVASRLASNYVLHPSSANADHRWPRHMAWAEGFEPPTVGLEIRCSIQLSYAHVYCRRCWFVRFWQVNLSYDPSGVYCSLGAYLRLKAQARPMTPTAALQDEAVVGDGEVLSGIVSVMPEQMESRCCTADHGASASGIRLDKALVHMSCVGRACTVMIKDNDSRRFTL